MNKIVNDEVFKEVRKEIGYENVRFLCELTPEEISKLSEEEKNTLADSYKTVYEIMNTRKKIRFNIAPWYFKGGGALIAALLSPLALIPYIMGRSRIEKGQDYEIFGQAYWIVLILGIVIFQLLRMG
jgi:hypothetical protein